MARKELVKDYKSRNTLSKVQSRKTCCEFQLSNSNLKKPTLVKRNSFVYSTVIGAKFKPRQIVTEIPKGKPKPDIQTNKRTKRVL